MQNAKGQEVDEEGNFLCIYDISGYGPCHKPKEHLVHAGLGMSPREHPFKRLLVGKVKEVKLSKRNLKKVSRESGMSVDNLKIIRQAKIAKGQPAVVRYEVLGDE